MADTELTLFTFQIPVVMIHPNLIKPRKFSRTNPKTGVKTETGELKYGGTFVFEQDEELARLKADTVRAVREFFGGQVKLASLKFPFQDGNKAADIAKSPTDKNGRPKKVYDGEFMRGKCIVKASSKFRPQLAVIENGRVLEIGGDEADESVLARHASKFYFGVETLAEFSINPHDAVGEDGQPGVNFYLQKVLSTNKGKKLAGGRTAAETFKHYIGHHSSVDPTQGTQEDWNQGAGGNLDDEIPF